MDIFDGKVLMVTGGTGSFGHAVVRRFLKTKIKEIRILSRDEKKQDDMDRLFRAGSTSKASMMRLAKSV